MNNDVIKQLPDSVANQIAAGEVINEPASVIKELVENAIDAGAKHIQIVLKDAGKSLMQVIDDGCGMSVTDARMAFEKHATSKISKADDLFTLHTMGFRGEALPSIAAVSEVDMRTMRRGDHIGTRIVINGSKVISQQPEVCMPGTNIMVKNLFYNFVARRRFLKKDSKELSQIVHEFERLALVNTDVDFSLTHNGTVMHQLMRGPLKSRIGQLFGRTVERQIIPIEAVTPMVKITGFVGLPEGARQRNPLQYFFVNGRNMKHPYFRKAVVNCYHNLIAAEMQPNFFISFELDPERIDVNVHPQKHEIKFEDEQVIWQVLEAAVRESLGKYNVGPAIDFTATDVPDIPPLQADRQDIEQPDEQIDPSYNPFEMRPFDDPIQQKTMFSRADNSWQTTRKSALNNDWQKLYDTFRTSGLNPTVNNETRADETADVQLFNDEDTNNQMFEFRNKWIITSTRSGLMLIDRRRAHIRVLYDSLQPQLNNGSLPTQKLIFDEEVEADASISVTISENAERLQAIGFDLEQKSPTVWLVKGVPSQLGSISPRQALLEIIAGMADGTETDATSIQHKMALALARTAAVRSDRAMTNDEMQRLVSDLLRSPSPMRTPDGLTIIVTLTDENLISMFSKR